MLSLATVRERWPSFLGTFVALSLGVALLAVGGLLLTSARPHVPDRYAGTTVLVQSPAVSQADGMFTESRPWSAATTRSLVDRLRAVPGVAVVVADRSFYVQPVIDGHAVGDPRVAGRQGHGWSSAALAPYRLRAGAPPRRDDEVVLDHRLGLPPGTPVTLLTATGPARFVVRGTVDGPGVYLTDTAAIALAPGVRVIGVVAASGADVGSIGAAVRATVGGDGTVHSGDGRAELEPKYDARTRWIGSQVITATAALAAFVSIFVVASTFAFSVVQRRRMFALLRLVGASPRQVRTLVYGEGLIIGVAGAAVGLALGALGAPLVGRVLVDAGLEPPTFVVRITALPLGAAFGLGLLVALAGVGSAARRAARALPLAALREAAVERRPMTRLRWIFGVLFLAAGIALSIGTAAADARAMVNYVGYASMALIVGVTLLGPAIVPPLVRLMTWPWARTRGATGLLVREGALVAARRIASTAAPVLIAVGFVVLITGSTLTSVRAYTTGQATALGAGALLVPDGTPGLSDAAVAATPGLSLLPTTLYLPGDAALSGSGVSPDVLAAAGHRLVVVAGSVADLTPGAMIVSAGTAARHGWQPGSTLSVTHADGTTAGLRVVAVLTDASAPAPTLLHRDAVRAHDPGALTGEVYLIGAMPPTPPGPGARVVDVADNAAQNRDEDDRLVWTFVLILIATSAGYAAIAVANTLLMATADRLGDFAVLRLAGATTGQVLRTVAAESTLVVGIGSMLGIGVTIPALLGVRSGLAEALDAPVELVVPWAAAVLVIGLCLLLALTASVVPAWAAHRRR
ncbi:MAG TPA: ABC transporter permease [Catenuloplanes sp.]